MREVTAVLMVAAVCAVLSTILAGIAVWRLTRGKVRRCFHHELPAGGWLGGGDRPARSYITAELIDVGRRKRFTCSRCGGSWYT